MSSAVTIDSFDWADFQSRIDKLIRFASAATLSPINSDRWEEIIYHTLKTMGLGYQGGPPKWELGSHAKGADLWTDNFAISAKAGVVKPDSLIISSYRLTRFGSLKEMKDYIDGPGRNFDIYLCCARAETTQMRTYKIFLIPVEVLVANDLSWAEMHGKSGGFIGWSGVGDTGVKVNIRSKMSNQLWVEVPLKFCKLLGEINIPIKTLGNALEGILINPAILPAIED